jgi:hypothetical protein
MEHSMKMRKTLVEKRCNNEQLKIGFFGFFVHI